MITLKVLSTGSIGNCYILDCDGEKLILDAGVKKSEFEKGVDYNLLDIAGVLISHIHKDHSFLADKLKGMGLEVFEPYKGENFQTVQLGNYKIKTFELPHDGTENRGFLITHGKDKFLYMTDFEYCKYSFKKSHINHMIVECNYQKKYIHAEDMNFDHKVRGHCELETTAEFVKTNATDALESVILVHRGLTTTNPKECTSAIEKVVKEGARVHMAEKGTSYVLKE